MKRPTALAITGCDLRKPTRSLPVTTAAKSQTFNDDRTKISVTQFTTCRKHGIHETTYSFGYHRL